MSEETSESEERVEGDESEAEVETHESGTAAEPETEAEPEVSTEEELDSAEQETPSGDSVETNPDPATVVAAATANTEVVLVTSDTAAPKLRKYILPSLTLLALGALVIRFRTIILPFILALLIVYLMEPIVSRIGRTPDSPKGLPRWVAVILVYLVFIGTVTTFGFLIVPRFVGEAVKLGETAPKLMHEFRSRSLPELDDRIAEFIAVYLPGDSNNMLITHQTKELVLAARQAGAKQATATGHVLQRTRRAANIEVKSKVIETPEGGAEWSVDVSPSVEAEPRFSVEDALGTSGWRFARSNEAAVRLLPDTTGGVSVYLQDVEIEVEQIGDRRWSVRKKDTDRLPMPRFSGMPHGFDLQQTLDDAISGLVDTSNEGIGDVIDFARRLVVGVVQLFVAIILTLMVAAFMSIDLHRVNRFFRGMVPEDGRLGYDRLLAMADRSLAGVVRGQLLICLVNGLLTWVGLALIGVKFSVLLGVVAGILSVIPVFGTILSTVPIVIIGLTDGLATGAMALGWILWIHFVEANILNPKIIGSSAHIHPVIVIFALLAGESAFGLVGALLAVPTAALLLTLFNFVRLKAWRNEEAQVAT